LATLSLGDVPADRPACAITIDPVLGAPATGLWPTAALAVAGGFGRVGCAPEFCACAKAGIAIATAAAMATPFKKCFMRLFSAAFLWDDMP
jgi:hypothetical protein